MNNSSGGLDVFAFERNHFNFQLLLSNELIFIQVPALEKRDNLMRYFFGSFIRANLEIEREITL